MRVRRRADPLNPRQPVSYVPSPPVDDVPRVVGRNNIWRLAGIHRAAPPQAAFGQHNLLSNCFTGRSHQRRMA